VCTYRPLPQGLGQGDHESPFERVSFGLKEVKESTGTRSVTTFDWKFCTAVG
jgi:hypothetical protein